VGLRDFQLRFALRATENLAFFYFVFIDIYFGGTLGAANHGSILHRFVSPAAREARITAVSVLYTPQYEVNRVGKVHVRKKLGMKCAPAIGSRFNNGFFPRIS
jgi:hypothetical protein